MANDGGWTGSEHRADCRVRVAAAAGWDVSVRCGSPPLLEAGIRKVVEKVARAAGVTAAKLEVEDFGALDYVLAARVEGALRAASMAVGAMAPAVERVPTPRGQRRWSRLYAPGNNPRLLAGIELHGADCVLLDLEDAVPTGQKLAARLLVKHLLAAVAFPAEVWVRVNPLDDGGRDDLAEVIPARPHGICLPKAEGAEDVRVVAEALSSAEADVGIPDGTIWLMPIVETARGVLHSEEIAAADRRVVTLAFGAEDYLRDTGATRSRETLLWPRAQLVAAARAAGVQVSDTVYADVEDDEGLAEEARSARALGFDGKGAIHPRQVAILHEAFAPSEEDLENARRIVVAADDAEARGLGAVAVDGRMVDRPVLERARRTLRMARRQDVGETEC